jgi:hypothetical protein
VHPPAHSLLLLLLLLEHAPLLLRCLLREHLQ